MMGDGGVKDEAGEELGWRIDDDILYPVVDDGT
jgi:hypothetical protein